MADEISGPNDAEQDPNLPGSVLAMTDAPVSLNVVEIEDERVPEGMQCLGTYLDGTLVARCAVPPGTAQYFLTHKVFGEPRQLVLAAREEEPGLRCELYAIVPMPVEALEEHEEEPPEPWAASVPSSDYEASVREIESESHEPTMVAVLLGQIVRFAKDRKHPDSLPLETVDVLSRIVSGSVVEVIDKVLGDLLGP